MSFVPLVRLWLWVSAFASASGWLLSALGQLNRTGYCIAFAIFAALVYFGRRQLLPEVSAGGLMKFLRRFRRPLPLCFAGLAFLIFLGGALYHPSNYTGLNYHLGRVLQWLSHGHWLWIHTSIVRMNYSGCDFEWLTTPIVLFTQSDRAIFLVNFISFLLLPGLIFSFFIRHGVARRVAWQWMWLLPTGYNFLLQAGSIANDTFPVVYALAAVDFAARAWRSKQVSDVWHSTLAAGLLTGVKASNLPLLLPWAILVFGTLPLVRPRLVMTLLVGALTALVSFLPLAVLNHLYCGDWLGRSVETINKESHQPLVGIFGNGLQLFLGNFLPPIFPLAGWWNAHSLTILPQAIVHALKTNFEGGILVIGELPTEDWIGLGFGLSWLLVVSVVASVRIRVKSSANLVNRAISRWLGRGVSATAWLALLAYCLKSGMNTAPRLITPYYTLMLPLLLAGAGQAQIIRRRWWRVLAGIVLCLALVVLVLSPDRPLWPAKTVLSWVNERHSNSHMVTRALKVYTVYSQRWDALAPVRDLLPPSIEVVGFMPSADDCDISLWRPFGSRRVEHVMLKDSPEAIRRRGLEYVVVSGSYLESQGVTFQEWLRNSGAEFIASTNATLKVVSGPQEWDIVRFKP